MKQLIFALCCTGTLFSCGNPPTTTQNGSEKKDTVKFFLTTPFLLSQIQYLDSTPIGMLMVSGEEGKDSTYINKDQFHALAYQFLQPDLNDTALSPYYTEESYFDPDLNKIITTISTKKRDAMISQAQVYLNKETRSVTGLYIEKNYSVGDTDVQQRLRWKADRNFQIITRKLAGGKENTTNQLVIWDNRN